MPHLEFGDSALYRECKDESCPDAREGKRHAHLVSVLRADGSLDTVESEDGDGALVRLRCSVKIRFTYQ